MRNLKRVLTMIMAIAMMMSLMVVGAGAAFSDSKDIANKDAVEKMVSLNIINGRDDGKFDPSGIVTRAEMAKMIAIALNGGNDPKLSASSVVTSSFTDTKSHWAAGYIEYAVNMGIVSGLGDNTFAPDQGVTATQAAKMLLVALGYDAQYEKFVGTTWALNVNKIAMQKGLYEEIQGIDPNAPMTRDNAAQMTANFCDSTMVKYEYGISGTGGNVTGVKQATDIASQTILAKYYKLDDTKTGIMKDWSYDKDKKEFKYAIGAAAASFNTTKDFTKFFGQNVQILFKDKNSNGNFDATTDEVYDIIAKDSKVILNGLVGDFDPIATTVSEFKYDNVTYKLTNTAENIAVYNNGDFTALAGKNLSTYSNADKAANAHFNFALIDNTGDDKGDILVVYPYTVEKITYVDSKSATTNTNTFKFEDCNVYAGIAKNDWVQIVDDANAVTCKDTLTKLTVATGEISTIKSATKIVMDGKTYINAAGATGDLSYKIGNKMELVAVNGYIFNAKKLATAATKENLALVIQADTIGAGTELGKQQVKMLLADGTKKVVKVDKIDGNDLDATYSFTGGGNYALETIFKYSIDKDGNYELDAVVAADYDTQKTVTNAAVLDTGKLTDATYTARFADDAVIFYYNGTEYKATTGGTVNGWSKYAANSITGELFASKTDGFLYTQVGFLKLTSAPSDKSTKYGYIVAAPELVKSGDDYYYQITVFNGTEDITLKAESTATNNTITSNAATMVADTNVAKGTAIAYKISGDGVVEKVTKLAETNAIIAYTDGKNAVGLKEAPTGATSTDLKLTADSVIIRFSSEDVKGQAGNGITVAKETAPGVYQKNCYVVANSDNEIEVLIIDKESDLGVF